MNDFKDQRKGFTLIELLIVVGIIAVLASVVFVSVKGARERAAIARGLHFSAQVDHSLLADVIGKWPLNEGTGATIHDISGGKRDGTLKDFSGDYWKDDNPAGKEGWSLEFDGNSNIEVSNLSSSLLQSGGTISVWVKPNITSRAAILFKNDSGYDAASKSGFDYIVDAEDQHCLCFRINKGTSVCSESNSISNNGTKWQNAVVTYDSGGKVIHYINGVQSGTSGMTNVSSQVTTTQPLIIGSSFEGLMTDVKIYGSPLSASQIQERYYAELKDLMARGIIE